MSKTVDITDFSSPALDVYARLTENQLVSRADPANAMFIAESPLVIGRRSTPGMSQCRCSWRRGMETARARRS